MDIRKLLVEKIHNNNWDYDEHMAQSNAPTPDERLADSIVKIMVQMIEENMIRHEPVGNGDKWREEVFTTFGWNAALDNLVDILKGKNAETIKNLVHSR